MHPVGILRRLLQETEAHTAYTGRLPSKWLGDFQADDSTTNAGLCDSAAGGHSTSDHIPNFARLGVQLADILTSPSSWGSKEGRKEEGKGDWKSRLWISTQPPRATLAIVGTHAVLRWSADVCLYAGRLCSGMLVASALINGGTRATRWRYGPRVGMFPWH